MKKLNIYILGGLFIGMLPIAGFSQNQKANLDGAKKLGEAVKSEVFEQPLAGKVKTPTGDLEWTPTLIHKPEKVTHDLPGKEELDAMKAEKLGLKLGGSKIYEEEEEEIQATAAPVVGNDFPGNPNSGFSPMDNSIAISNGGIIVTVANATIEYNTMSGVTTYSNSLVDFVNDPAISSICDPVVLYDPQADRFIFFAQECVGHSSSTHLLILFSETNNPADGWNYYKLTGNPLADGSWFDYPKVAISDTELFITGNLFYNSGGFNQSVVYQMEKNDGYAGASLTWQYWSGIPGSPFTMLAVSSGNEFNYGPGIYLVATQSFSGNTVKLYDITDAIAGSPSMNYYSVSTSSYEVAADSYQDGTGCLLDNGDCRSLSGFYLDGIIHFVFHSDVGSGWNGINYNRLDVASLTNVSDEFGDPGNLDFSYPSIAWFGLTPSDRSVLISFGSVSSDVYPQIRAVYCDNAMNWSETTLVRSSTSYACFTSPSIERWGDYTGTARKHNAPEPTVWIDGMFGTAGHTWNTWIAEINADYHVGIAENNQTNKAGIAPNPVNESFVVSFEAKEDMAVDIHVIGLDGRIVKELYSGKAFAGKNQFAFNTSNLASGTYMLQIMSSNKQIVNERIVIQ